MLIFSFEDTSEERDKFLHDARRLAFDLSENQTFATVKPLLNFWAAFSPSNEVSLNLSFPSLFHGLAPERNWGRRRTKRVCQ